MKTDVEKWLSREGKEFLEGIGIKMGQNILDFGCGNGHYTVPAARLVGKKGKVYALDKDREVLNQLLQTVELEGLENCILMHIQSPDLKINLKVESFDVILLYDVLHYFDAMERDRIYNECYRVLKYDGFLSVYPKHRKSDEPLWNFSDMELEDVIKEIEDAKFNFDGMFYKKLIHDNHYDIGYVLNFTKNKKEEKNG